MLREGPELRVLCGQALVRCELIKVTVRVAKLADFCGPLWTFPKIILININGRCMRKSLLKMYFGYLFEMSHTEAYNLYYVLDELALVLPTPGVGWDFPCVGSFRAVIYCGWNEGPRISPNWITKQQVPSEYTENHAKCAVSWPSAVKSVAHQFANRSV